MRMKCRFVIFIAALLPILCHAQTDDTGLWMGASVEKKLSKKWSIEAEGEYRLMDDMQTTDRFSIGLSTSYKIMRWLKADAGYDYLHSREPGEYTGSGNYYKSAYWCPRHRVHASLAATAKLTKNLRLSLRERWVYTYRPSFDRNRINVDEHSAQYGIITAKEEDGKCKNALRSRLLLDYKIKKSGFTPFVSLEAYTATGGKDGDFGNLQKLRYSLGTEYEFTKHHAVKLYYLFQDYKEGEDEEGNNDRHVVGVSYGYSF